MVTSAGDRLQDHELVRQPSAEAHFGRQGTTSYSETVFRVPGEKGT